MRDVAVRLKKDGVKVWLDEWEINPGDSIPAKIEEGLERSRVLVLCMSANAFGSDWAQLECGTFRFRDLLHKERLRITEVPLPSIIKSYTGESFNEPKIYSRWTGRAVSIRHGTAASDRGIQRGENGVVAFEPRAHGEPRDERDVTRDGCDGCDDLPAAMLLAASKDEILKLRDEGGVMPHRCAYLEPESSGLRSCYKTAAKIAWQSGAGSHAPKRLHNHMNPSANEIHPANLNGLTLVSAWFWGRLPILSSRSPQIPLVSDADPNSDRRRPAGCKSKLFGTTPLRNTSAQPAHTILWNCILHSVTSLLPLRALFLTAFFGVAGFSSCIALASQSLSEVCNELDQYFDSGGFKLGINKCDEIGGSDKFIATEEDPLLVERYLNFRANFSQSFADKILTERKNKEARSGDALSYWGDYFDWLEQLPADKRSTLLSTEITVKKSKVKIEQKVQAAAAALGATALSANKPADAWIQYEKITDNSWLGPWALRWWLATLIHPNNPPSKDMGKIFAISARDLTLFKKYILDKERVDHWRKFSVRLKALKAANRLSSECDDLLDKLDGLLPPEAQQSPNKGSEDKEKTSATKK